MDSQLAVEVTESDGLVVIAVDGEIDVSNIARVRSAFDSAIAGGVRYLIADLSKVDFMDSTGVNLLVRVIKVIGSAAVGVVASRPMMLRLLELSGIDKIVPISSSLAEAVGNALGIANDPE